MYRSLTFNMEFTGIDTTGDLCVFQSRLVFSIIIVLVASSTRANNRMKRSEWKGVGLPKRSEAKRTKVVFSKYFSYEYVFLLLKRGNAKTVAVAEFEYLQT